MTADIPRLVVEYFTILEAQQREALGEDAEAVVAELEQSTTGTRRLAEAKRALLEAIHSHDYF